VIGEEQITSKILDALPATYETVVTARDLVGLEKQTLELLKSRLLEEVRIKKHESSTVQEEAFLSQKTQHQRKQRQKKASIEEGRRIQTVTNAAQRGHWARECKSKHSQNREERDKGLCRVFISTFEVKNISEKDIWILDSGATEHMTFRENWMEDTVKIQGREVSIADERKVPVTAKEMSRSQDSLERNGNKEF
jgi:hypothetical protein